MPIDPCLIYPDTIILPSTMLYPSGLCPGGSDPGIGAWVPMQVRPRRDAVRVKPT